jgi:H+/gluconate symporter-like permease
MVPPHPGPLTAIATLKTSVAPTMLYGFIAAIPAIVLGGPVYARFIAPKMTVRPELLSPRLWRGENRKFYSCGNEVMKSPWGTAKNPQGDHDGSRV